MYDINKKNVKTLINRRVRYKKEERRFETKKPFEINTEINSILRSYLKISQTVREKLLNTIFYRLKNLSKFMINLAIIVTSMQRPSMSQSQNN